MDREAEAASPGVNPWLVPLFEEIAATDTIIELGTFSGSELSASIGCGEFGLWIIARPPDGGGIAFCVGFSPDGNLKGTLDEVGRGEFRITAVTPVGRLRVDVHIRGSRHPLLQWKTSIEPDRPLSIASWPHDIYPLGPDEEGPFGTSGNVYTTQREGIGTPLLFAGRTGPKGGSFLYVQNLTSLNRYFEKTGTAPEGTILSEWPVLGFSLPSSSERTLPAGEEVIISDARVRFTSAVPESREEEGRIFLDLYADIYRALPHQDSYYRDWHERTGRTLRHLTHSPVCSTEIDGLRYMLPYVGANDRPPESMVQLALLVPMVEYSNAVPNVDIPLIEEIERNLESFWDPDLGTIVRWLPSQRNRLKGQEEHMKPWLMDSWYLHHPLLNLARLFELGRPVGKELFVKSVDYAVNVARHFEYRWPVFYDMRTLEVLKAERAPGKGGELDTGAIYIAVMMKAWAITGDEEYIHEAERAAERLVGLGFDLLYQLNNTIFGANALLELWKITGRELYRDLSYVCIANVMRNCWLWKADYGSARFYHTYMGIPPLINAPYLALFEELETLAGFHSYLRNAGDDALPSVRILLSEYCRHVIDRAWCYYPDEMPKTIMATESQSGHISGALSIPLEDIYSGEEKPGKVGQEVYGAAAPLVFATRHCHFIPGLNFILYCNYPVEGFQVKKSGRAVRNGGTISFRILGHGDLWSEVRVIPEDNHPSPLVRMRATREGTSMELDGEITELGDRLFQLRGDVEVFLAWGNGIELM